MLQLQEESETEDLLNYSEAFCLLFRDHRRFLRRRPRHRLRQSGAHPRVHVRLLSRQKVPSTDHQIAFGKGGEPALQSQ